MNAAIADGELDVVGLARPLVAEPELARALIEGEADGADDHIARLDPLHAMSWYYRQLISLGAGDDVDFTLDAAEASALHLASEERAAAALVGRRQV
jgi:hypothetical protein